MSSQEEKGPSPSPSLSDDDRSSSNNETSKRAGSKAVEFSAIAMDWRLLLEFCRKL